jgi:hypothetical protein
VTKTTAKFKKGDRVLHTPPSDYEDRTPLRGTIVEGPCGASNCYTVEYANDGKLYLTPEVDLVIAPFIYRVLVSDTEGLALASFDVQYPRDSHLTTAAKGLRAEVECIAENIAEEIEKHGAAHLAAAIANAKGAR